MILALVWQSSQSHMDSCMAEDGQFHGPSVNLLGCERLVTLDIELELHMVHMQASSFILSPAVS